MGGALTGLNRTPVSRCPRSGRGGGGHAGGPRGTGPDKTGYVLFRQAKASLLADLLISTVHRIGARAERKVTQVLVSEFRRVTGKETLLFRLAEAAIARPDDTEVGRAQRTIFLSVTWNQTERKIMFPLVSPRTEEKRWAGSYWRRSGLFWNGTRRRLGGCGSGPTLGERLGRSTPTLAVWPSISTGASARASTRWRRRGSTSPVTSGSSARGRAVGEPMSCRSTRDRGLPTPRSSSRWCRCGCFTTSSSRRGCASPTPSGVVATLLAGGSAGTSAAWCPG
jgi:hypothetical protein